MSVVVIARDAAATLPSTLRALAGEDVVVVDNASQDATAAVARAHGVRVVTEPVPGRARARNAGVAAARGDVVLFTDAACRPEPGWADALRRCLAAGERALAAGPIVVTTRVRPNKVERFDLAWRYRPAHIARGGAWAPTGNLAVRRAALERVGGFDAALPVGGEDVDLCLRIGGGVRWCPEAVVTLPAEHRLTGMLRRAHDRALSQDLLHVRHGLPADTSWRHPGGLVRGDWALTDLGLDPAEHREHLPMARLWRAGRSVGALRGRLARRRYARGR